MVKNSALDHADLCSSCYASNNHTCEMFSFVSFATIEIIVIIVIILHKFAGKCFAWNIWSEGTSTAQGPFCSVYHCTLYLDIPSTMMCSGFTATCSLRNSFTAVFDWTSLWFGCLVLIMEYSWSRQIRFSMLGFAPFLKLNLNLHTNQHRVQDVWLCPCVDIGWNLPGNIWQSWEW